MLIPDIKDLYIQFDLDQFLQYLISMSAAITSAYGGIKLYLYYTRTKKDYTLKQTANLNIQLDFISKLTTTTVLVSITYLFTQIIDIFVQGYGFQTYIWPFLEASIFFLLYYLCRNSPQLVLNEFKYDALKRQSDIINAMVKANGGYVWFKDDKGQYLFCDPTWCHFFFGIKENCNIIGSTDMELLDHFRSTKKLRHTFGDLCMNTDIYTKEKGKRCRYIECGYIGEQLVVLDVLKTPLFKNGEYAGVVGFAWERANECEYIFKDIEIYLETGMAEQLADGVYYIKDDLNECKWDRPFPSAIKE